ncbi:uncharacterized protein LOC115923368 [Strongylocentrotus purpuratus]|uniref:Uncharacterized protein n=1 Tax=Strongylocentrotus purpuratus TaxID=7668 RepID=A0A7M7SY26_STRPU|nr:uncharacterized protein LOC115923368 [Strongylocentrotus purpuratus]
MDSRILFWTQVILLVSTGSGILGQSPGDVRLVDGSSTLEGRVEVYYDNLWGTICNRGWDSTDSGVVCRQLGFQVSLSSPSFGAGIPTQRIWLADVQCESSDRRLNECVTDGQWGQTSTCPHNNDVGVRCSGLNVGIAPNYQGCYRFEDIPVSNSAITFESNTIETCLESCSINFMFAGLYGETCTCDDQINPSAQPVDNNMCRMPCPGSSAQLCGDDEVNMEFLSVYSVSVGDGYVSSPWFPGNYVLPSTDTSQPDNLISRTDVTASSGMLLIQVLAFDLAPGDTLRVEVGGMTINPTASGETILSGLPETTLVLTAMLTRAANSPGASGYLITFTTSTPYAVRQCMPWLIPVLASVIVLQFIVISVLLTLFCYQRRRKVRTRTGENEPDPYMDLQPRPEGDRTYQEMAITSTASSKTPGERRLPSPNLIYENQNVSEIAHKKEEGAHF